MKPVNFSRQGQNLIQVPAGLRDRARRADASMTRETLFFWVPQVACLCHGDFTRCNAGQVVRLKPDARTRTRLETRARGQGHALTW